MKFEECLQAILKKKQLSSEDRISYNNDAEEIRNYLMEQMKERNSEFKAEFDGLSLTGSYLDKLKINLPDEFDMHIKLKMPFDLKPHEDITRPGFVYLTSNSKEHRFITRNGKMSRGLLQEWLRSLFAAIIGKGARLKVNDRVYLIDYPKYARGSGVAHTVSAKDARGGREIWFDFVPAFEFSPQEWPFAHDKFNEEDKSWFAIPYGKKLPDTLHHFALDKKFRKIKQMQQPSKRSIFMVCAPHWERKALHDKKNLKNSLRLMKALRDANDLQRLTSYMLKSIYLEEIDKRPNEFWEQPMGEILIEMLKELEKALSASHLPFFLHAGHNHFYLLRKKLIAVYQNKVAAVLNKLQEYRDQDEVKFDNVAALFERQKKKKH